MFLGAKKLILALLNLIMPSSDNFLTKSCRRKLSLLVIVIFHSRLKSTESCLLKHVIKKKNSRKKQNKTGTRLCLVKNKNQRPLKKRNYSIFEHNSRQRG
jgi:hypothetical protein